MPQHTAPDDLPLLAERLRLGLPLRGFDGREIPLRTCEGQDLGATEAAHALLLSGASLLPADYAEAFVLQALARAALGRSRGVPGRRDGERHRRQGHRGPRQRGGSRLGHRPRTERQPDRPQPGDPVVVRDEPPAAARTARGRLDRPGSAPDRLTRAQGLILAPTIATRPAAGPFANRPSPKAQKTSPSASNLGALPEPDPVGDATEVGGGPAPARDRLGGPPRGAAVRRDRVGAPDRGARSRVVDGVDGHEDVARSRDEVRTDARLAAAGDIRRGWQPPERPGRAAVVAVADPDRAARSTVRRGAV